VSLDFTKALCKSGFYKDIAKATMSNGTLLFKHRIPEATLNNIYIRESYQSIASKILDNELDRVLLTGTPGIGKSMFLFYLFWQLVQKGKRVLFIYQPDTIYYDGQGGVFELATLPSVIDHTFWTKDLWCLFDAKHKVPADLGAIPYSKCAFVMSTSPRREMVSDFKKCQSTVIFYMPIWSEAEMGIIAPCYPAVPKWAERFKILGGIPRFVLEITKDSPTMLIRSACDQCSIDECIKAVGIDSTITEKSKIVHSLVHITSASPEFTQSSVCFASEAVLDILVEMKSDMDIGMMRGLLGSCEGNPLTAALCGYIFEPYAIQMLEKGGKFTYRKLDYAAASSVDITPELDIPSSTRKPVQDVALRQTPKQLHVPITKNFPALDAWIPGIGGFQMTVGKKHDIKNTAKEKLGKLGRRANKLYWLLPPKTYQNFKKVKPLDIDQYAILIPFPSPVYSI